LPVLQIGVIKYNFFVGARLALLWMASDVYPRVDLGAVLTLQFAGSDAPTIVGINVVALWAVWYLWRMARSEELPPNPPRRSRALLPNPQMQPTGRRGPALRLGATLLEAKQRKR
jgi:hypothetical protein